MRLRIRSLIFAVVVVGGCGGSGDTCDGIDFTEYTLNGIHATVLASADEMNAPEYHAYSFAAELPALPEEPLAYNHLVLEVQARRGLVQQLPVEQGLRLQWSMFQPAYACSPPSSKPELKNLTITSTGDFSAEHMAGTDLSGLFYVTYNTGLEAIAYEEDGRSWSYTATQFMDFQPIAPDVLLLRLGRAPDLEQSHTFTVQYHLADGRTISAETDSVQIALDSVQ